MADAPRFTQRITQAEYDRQAVDYTTEMVERLNADVRDQPMLGANSTFFQNPENVKKGLPVFQGKHTRFVYDSDEEEIVAAVDVTNAPAPGPVVRTVADLDSDEEEDEEEDDDHEAEEEEDDEEEEIDYTDEQNDEDMGVANEFYEDEVAALLEDSQIGALLQDVFMELAAFDLDDPRQH